MAIINQPKPSEPKSPQPDQQPLQPGDAAVSRSNSANQRQPNPQTPDDQEERIRGGENG
jgi:hypothetical protein